MDEYKGLKPKEETDISNIDSFSNNISNFREIKADNFEENLNISDIIEENNKIQQNENNKRKKNIVSNVYTHQSIDNDFSEELDNINEEEFNQRKISISSSQSEELNYNNANKNINSNVSEENNNNKKIDIIKKKVTRRLTKEELNYIPLPVFSCIYCSNENIAFNHLIQENISNNYLLQTSVYDIKDINKLIIYQPIQDKDDKNEKLIDIVIKNTDYIYKNYNYESINIFFHSKNYIDLCSREFINNKKYFIQKIEESIIKKKKDFYFKGINKIPKNSLNNRCLFNSTNSLINNYNALSGFVETIPINNNNINIGKMSNTNNSNISINFNSISLNNNEIGNCNAKDNNNLLSIVENIENNIESGNELDDKDEIMNFFEFDMERKITRDKIVWENKFYDIWNPVISDEEENNSNEYGTNINNKNNSSSFKVDINNNHKFKNNNKVFNQCNNNKYNSKLLNLTNKEFNVKDKNDEINGKNYKLKVNVIKSNELLSKTSNNSFNYNLFRNVSQMKSMGSTNNSSVINCDNEYKMKSHINIFSHLKSFTNNSQNVIHVNTKKINVKLNKIKNTNSMAMNRSISLKSKNLINELINNQFKTNHNYNYNCICNSSIFNSNKFKKKFNTSKKNNNNINSNLSNFNTTNNNYNYNNSFKNIMINEKYRKKKIKIFDERKAKEKMKKIGLDKKNKNNNSRKINTFNTPNSVFKNKRSKNKSTIGNRTADMTFSTSINSGTKVISSKIIFKQNNNISKTNFINSQKSFQFKKNKLSYCSFKNNNEKTSLERIRNKISEISKLINNNKNFSGYNTHNKLNSNKIVFKYNSNANKTKNKLELNTNKSINNKLNASSDIKTCINKSKKLLFSSSFIVKPKVKIAEKTNFKKIINTKK